MTMICQFITRLKAQQDGATAVEYAIMVALIAAVIIGAVVTIGNNSKQSFECVGDQIANPDNTGCSPIGG